jgi:membrane fusion protein (multidrug efflux system)
MSRAAFILSLLAMLLASCTEDPGLPDLTTTAPDEPLPVEIHVLALESLEPHIEVVGVVQAAEQIELSADVSAPISRILVLEGQEIQRGDLLIEMDAEKLELQLVRAQESLNQANSNLVEAEAFLKRRAQLAEQQTVSQEMLDAARYDWQRSQAAVQEANAAVALARRELKDSRVLSPVDGVVDRNLVEAGETVRPGTELMIIQATGSLEVETHVSERDINYLRAGGAADVTISEWRQRSYDAVVQSVGIAANPRTGNFPVILLLQEPDGNIRPGMTAKVSIQGKPIGNVLLLPETALVDRDRERVVFVEEQGVARIRRPLLKAALSDHLLVLDGIAPGEHLIVSNLDKVVDGSRVSPIRSQP